MLGIRLEFTMNEFFANGGVVTFVDRMAAVLGIHKADIKVVAVYEGSTIIDFQIISDAAAEIPLDLQEVKKTFETVIATTEEFMGSPVIGAVATGTPVSTPFSAVAEDIDDVFDNIFGDDDDDDDEVIKKNDDVRIEFVH